MMRILLVEDEIQMAEAVSAVLKKNNYAVDRVHDGEEGEYQALSGIYDAIVLDIMLPKKDGIEILKAIRSEGLTTPVILLTARTATQDKVTGLDAGADDYLPKPFEMEELLARIRALGRRHTSVIHENELKFGDISYSPQQMEIVVGEASYKLTKKEGHLLDSLIRSKGRIVSKEMMIDKVWGFDGNAIDNNVEVYISFLRKKLKSLNAQVKIKTVRGIGYKLEEGDD